MKIVVTLPVDETQRAQLEAAAPEAAFVFESDKAAAGEALPGAEVLIGNLPPAVIQEKGAALRWVQLNSAGTDGYCVPGVLPADCVLTNATGGYSLAIPECMIGYLFALFKKLPVYWEQQKRHVWQSAGTVRTVAGSTVVCLGMGDIGGAFAQRCKALGCTVIGVKRRPAEKPDFVDELYTNDRLDEVLPRADVLAMSLPNTPETRHILNARTIGLLKDGAIVINVGRGSAIDQDALCAALHSGKLAGAAIDVTDPEPLPEDHPLWDAPNLILTPHVTGGWSIPETLERIVDICAENLTAYQSGLPLRNIIDFETGYKK